MKIIKKFWPVIVFLCIVIFSIVNSDYQGMKENKVVYNFRISKLDTTPTQSLNFYNGSNKVVLWNYIISARGGAEIGDYLIKDRCAKILYIKRKNAEGKLVVIDSSNNISYLANLGCD